MATERKRLVLLSALVVVLAVVLYRVMSPPAPETAGGATKSDGAATRTAGQEPAPGGGAPEVHLQALEEDRPKPSNTPRNPFGFAVLAPPPSARPSGPLVSAPPPSVPAGPPPPPAIPLKFIGIFETGPRRIAN